MGYLVNKERLLKEFFILSGINAHSFEEREKADYLKSRLLELGFEVEEDNAGKFYNGNAGNLYAYKKGTMQGEPLLLSAHMDTVAPGNGIKPSMKENGLIVSDGSTVLGADDNAGLVSILEAFTVIKENQLQHRDVELLFTIGEEAYLKGSEVFDYHKVKAKQAYVLDLSGKIGTAAIKAPTLLSFTVTVQGKASHAGFAPEEGINAIQIASNVISRLQQGRLNDETTLNVGQIQGGISTNIVSEECVFMGEVRSLQHEEAQKQITILENLLKEVTKESHASYDIETKIGCISYSIESDSNVIKRFQQVCQTLDLDMKLITTLGGSDNNNLVKHGIQGIVLACGMEQVHSCQEYTDIKELLKSAQVVLELIKSEI